MLNGPKRATAGLLWFNEEKNKPIPKAGDLSVITNWEREPLGVIETTQVDVVPFDEVDEAFAAAEGEGDGLLHYWRDVHWAYFSRGCAAIGREPSLSMPVICERFRLLYP